MLNPNQKRLIKALKEEYYVVVNACKRARISRDTYYEWFNNNEEFRAATIEVEQYLNVAIADRLKIEALNRQPWAIRFYLSRRHADFKQKVELSGGLRFYKGTKNG